MKYMIHAAPPRMWYVEGWLIPSMLAQGILPEEILVTCDEYGRGNLISCMESFKLCAEDDGGTWHLQDDVLISRDFAERTREHDLGVVCGFGCGNFGAQGQQAGRQPAAFMWYSFQCIRIPNTLAAECAAWFYDDAQHRSEYQSLIADKRHDDRFWRDFMLEKHRDMWVTNLTPCLVEHVDFLIGGTLINRLRAAKENRAIRFEDGDLVEKLREEISASGGRDSHASVRTGSE